MAKTSEFKCHCVEGESKKVLEYGRGWRLGDRWKDVVIVATSSIHLFLVLYFVIIIILMIAALWRSCVLKLVVYCVEILWSSARHLHPFCGSKDWFTLFFQGRRRHTASGVKPT